MAAPVPAYSRLAELLAYPDGSFAGRVRAHLGALEAAGDPAWEILAPFRRQVPALTLERAQELFTRTFDINPVCTLEVGWHVYGEDYARGAFLVEMRRRMREHGIPESTELPDHLTHVLSLLALLDGGEAEELAARYVLPALGKMIEAMAGTGNPYGAVLEAIVDSVKRRHRVEAVAPRRRRGDPPGWKNRLPIHGMPAGRGGSHGFR